MILEYLKKYEKNSILVSVVMIIISLLLIFKPNTVLHTVVMVFGLGVLLDSIIHIISYIKTDGEMKKYSTELIFGILELIAGILILANTKFLISVVPVIIGVWVIIQGVIKFGLSINVKEINGSNWAALMAIAILTVFLGIIILLNPFGTMVTATVFAGVLLLITQISELFESMYILRKIK